MSSIQQKNYERQIQNSKNAYQTILTDILLIDFVDIMDREQPYYQEANFIDNWKMYLGNFRDKNKYDKESFNYSEWACSVGWCNKFCSCKIDEDELI